MPVRNDAKLYEDVGYMRGKLDELAATMDRHMTVEEARLLALDGRASAQDTRLRSVERKMHTTWIIGGGALGIAGTFLAHLFGLGKG